MEINWQITQRRIVATVLAANAAPVKEKRVMLKHLRAQFVSSQNGYETALDVFFPHRGIFGCDVYMAQALALGPNEGVAKQEKDEIVDQRK